MWRSWIVFVPLLCGAVHSKHTHSGLSCVNNYITRISCEWRNSEQHSGQDCQLHAERDVMGRPRREHCALEPLSFQFDAPRGCLLDFRSPDFNFADEILLEVICNGSVADRLEQFNPGRNIKLDPVDRPRVDRGNITWNKGTASGMSCQYQLQFKPLSQNWEDTKPVDVDLTYAVRNNESLVLGGQYEVRVRVKPVEKDKGWFYGQWSDWSPSVSWTSDIGKIQTKEIDFKLTPGLLCGFLVLVILPILVIIITIAHRCCTVRADGEHVPDPSKYFQPLLSTHGGNFQKWLGPQHSTPSLLTPQSCDCDISPVEVSDMLDSILINKMLYFHTMSSSQGTSGQSSSGFSNMGYFYSETQPGSLNLETCPVYFTYHPEDGGSSELQSTSSYECLQRQGQLAEVPSSPDSGFSMGEEEEEAREEEEMETEGRSEESPVINVQHLVSFVLTLPKSSRAIASSTANQVPLSFAQLPELLPWPEVEEDEVDIGNSSEPPEGAVVRPSSMVVQPCSSGYLTLKEMQKYSNKSI